MTDLEKRAHDIAVSILPYALGKDFEYYTLSESQRGKTFDSFAVVDEYEELYFKILERLQEFRDL